MNKETVVSPEFLLTLLEYLSSCKQENSLMTILAFIVSKD